MMEKLDSGRRLSLDQRLECLETAVTDSTRTFIRSINTEWQKVEQYKETLIMKEDEILAGMEHIRHLKETLNHVEKNLVGTESRMEYLKKSNEELKKNISRLRREEGKVSKEYDREKQNMNEKLRFYEDKWKERYQTRYANKPLVQEHEKAKKALEDVKEKLKLLKSDLRECQSEIFKAKCERGKRNAEESGFYPLESFIVRIATVGNELMKTEAEEIEKSKDISRTQCNIAVIKKSLYDQAKKPKSNTRTNEQVQFNKNMDGFPMKNNDQVHYNKTMDGYCANTEEPFIRNDSSRIIYSDLENTNTANGKFTRYMQPEAIQHSTVDTLKKNPIAETVKQSNAEGKVRHRIEKLKLYTPNFYSPPATQIVSSYKEPRATSNENYNISKTPAMPQKRNIPEHQSPRKHIETTSSFFKDSSNLISARNDAKAQRKESMPNANKNYPTNFKEKLPNIPQRNHTDQYKYSAAPTSRLSSEDNRKEQKERYDNSNFLKENEFASKKMTADKSFANFDTRDGNFSKKTNIQYIDAKKLRNASPDAQFGNVFDIPQNEVQDKKTLNERFPEANKTLQGYEERRQNENLLQKLQKSSVENFNRKVENIAINPNDIDRVNTYNDNLVQPMNIIGNDKEEESETRNIEEIQTMDVDPNHEKTHSSGIEESRLNNESAQDGAYDSFQVKGQINSKKTLSREYFHRENKPVQEQRQHAEVNLTLMEGIEDTSLRSMPKNTSISVKDSNYLSAKATLPQTSDTGSKVKMYTVENKDSDSGSNKEVTEKKPEGLPERNGETNLQDGSNNLNSETKSQIPTPLSQKSLQEKEVVSQSQEIENSNPQVRYDESQNIPGSSKSNDSSVYLTATSNGNISDKIQVNFNSPPKTIEIQTPKSDNSNSQAVTSPFDFEKHMNALREIKMTPKYTYQSRFMYKSPDKNIEPTPIEPIGSIPEGFNSINYFHGHGERNSADSKPQEPEKLSEDKSDFLSFAFEDYLADSPSPPDAGEKDKPMFGFGADSPKTVKSPGFFPLFAADTQEAENDGKTGFVLNFGSAEKVKSPEESGGFKFMF